jgi:hypothetical protein
MLALDPPFVAVAADRRLSVWSLNDAGERQLVGRHQATEAKVCAHPTLPIVWVTGGLDGVNDLILEALNNLPPRPLNETVVPAMQFLSPLVAQSAIERLEVLIGMVDHGMAGAAHVQFLFDKSSARAIMPGSGHILASAHCQPFVDRLPLSARFPRVGSTPIKIATHMRRLLGRAIDSARELAGDQADVGGIIDLAIVGPGGAQVLPPTRGSIPVLN